MSTTDQLTNYLYKRSLFVGTTNTETQFFSEPKKDYPPVYPLQVWAQQAIIPATAPVLPPNGIDGTGTVQYKFQLALTAMPSGYAFFSSDLINAIPFNYDSGGSYNYTLYDNSLNVIPFGLGNWFVDPGSGILLFTGTVPPDMPPKITFYKYVGALGLTTSNITDANGITIITDGPNGINPVNKANSAIINAFYNRNNDGFIILDGPEPPGGLSNVAPFGVVNNDANFTTLVRKVSTTNTSSVNFISFPSNAGNNQSYGISIKALGTSALPPGETIYISTEASFCYTSAPTTIPLVFSKNGSGPLTSAALQISYDGTYFQANVIGANGYLIQWIITIQYIQYRIS